MRIVGEGACGRGGEWEGLSERADEAGEAGEADAGRPPSYLRTFVPSYLRVEAGLVVGRDEYGPLRLVHGLITPEAGLGSVDGGGRS